jgi:hypothetical protein
LVYQAAISQARSEGLRYLNGAGLAWFMADMNHNHARYSDMIQVFRYLNGPVHLGFLGPELAQYGLDLPCSDPDLRAKSGSNCP